MILNMEKEGSHYFALKKLSALLHGTTSKHKGDFYCLNCLHSSKTESKLKSHGKVCKYKDFYGIVMPSQKDNILQFSQYVKPDKMPCIIYADLESLVRIIDECANNSGKSSKTKIGEHIAYGFSMLTI